MNMGEVNPLIGGIQSEVRIATPILDTPNVLCGHGSQTEILSGYTGAHIIDTTIVIAAGEDPGGYGSGAVATNAEL